MLAKAIAVSIGTRPARIQGNPDLLPSDITGVSVYSASSDAWEFLGRSRLRSRRAFRRAEPDPPRSQAALLEAMEERQVSVDGESWPLPEPHLVLGDPEPDRSGRNVPARREPDGPLPSGDAPWLPGRGDRDEAGAGTWSTALALLAYARMHTRGAGVGRLQSPRFPSHPPSPATPSPSSGRAGTIPSSASAPAHGPRSDSSWLPAPVRSSKAGASCYLTTSRPSPSAFSLTGSSPMPDPSARSRLVSQRCRRFSSESRRQGRDRTAFALDVTATSRARTRKKRRATRHVRSLALPERAFGPVAGTILLLFVWTGVAHASGSGWVQAVGSVVAGLLLLGLVAPAFAAPGLTVICERSPSDTPTGSQVLVDLVGNRSMRVTPRSVGACAPLDVAYAWPVVIVPNRRGVITSITVRVANPAPFGLLWWSRDQVVELPRSPVRRAASADGAPARSRQSRSRRATCRRGRRSPETCGAFDRTSTATAAVACTGARAPTPAASWSASRDADRRPDSDRRRPADGPRRRRPRSRGGDGRRRRELAPAAVSCWRRARSPAGCSRP